MSSSANIAQLEFTYYRLPADRKLRLLERLRDRLEGYLDKGF